YSWPEICRCRGPVGGRTQPLSHHRATRSSLWSLGNSSVFRGGNTAPDGGRVNTNRQLWGGLYHMLHFVKKFVRDERGEDLMEYGLLVAFVATIALAVIITDPLGFGTAIQDAYQRAVDALNQA